MPQEIITGKTIDRFDRPHDVHLRVGQSLVKFEDEYMFAGSHETSMNIWMLPLKQAIENQRLYEYFTHGEYGRLPYQISANHINLDFRTPELGFGNLDVSKLNRKGRDFHYNLGAFKINRTPTRRYTHGLSYNNCKYQIFSDNMYRPHVTNLFANPGFLKMLENTYPDLDEAKSLLKSDQAESISIHKNWYINKDELGIVKYFLLNKPIGFSPPNSQNVYLGESFQSPYIHEKLKKEISSNLKITG